MNQAGKIEAAVSEVLTDPDRNGVYRLSQPVTGPMPVLDGRAMRSKKSLLAAMAGALGFPDHFGDNWDALEECLSDMDWRDGPIALQIEHADVIPKGVLTTLIEVFRDVSQVWTADRRCCSLFLCDVDRPEIVQLA